MEEGLVDKQDGDGDACLHGGDLRGRVVEHGHARDLERDAEEQYAGPATIRIFPSPSRARRISAAISRTVKFFGFSLLTVLCMNPNTLSLSRSRPCGSTRVP